MKTTHWRLSVIYLFVMALAPVGARAESTVPDDGWPVASAQESGFDAASLSRVLSGVEQGKDNIHSIVLERRGRIVAELYRTGRDHPLNSAFGLWPPFGVTVQFDESKLHDIRSITKSVVSLLFGIEMGKSVVPGLDTPVLNLYPQLRQRYPGSEKITLRHLMTMSSGLKWREIGYGTWRSNETRLDWVADPVRYYLDRPLVTEPGTTFNYSGGAPTTLADLLVRLTGKPLTELAREDLFSPLGITDWQWVTDIHGRPLAFAGLRMRPRDMLKIGRLVNDKGRWNGRVIVPESWIADSIQPHIRTGIPFMSVSGEDVWYGYQWWTAQVDWNGREVRWSAAIGNGGQRIYVVPELDLTCVITAGDYGTPAIQKTVGRLFGGILATVKK